MDLQTIRTNITTNQYELRRQFLADIKQMLDNSRLYNGDTHPITGAARGVSYVKNMRNRLFRYSSSPQNVWQKTNKN